MTLISRKIDYALLILADLHHRPQGASARQIADRYMLSRPFVANILKELCRQGFVASHRGVKGGYTLQRPPESVSLAELMDALAEPFQLMESGTPMPEESSGLSSLGPMRMALAGVQRRIQDVLHSVTLAELFYMCRPPHFAAHVSFDSANLVEEQQPEAGI